jgi:anthranilate synthase component 2
MKILILDNYDSFTYNLLHYVQDITNAKIDVIRNDKISIEEINHYDGIILSPGPGLPSDTGVMCDLIKKYGSSKKILGVCLGHQAIAEVYGAKLENMLEVMHGVSSKVQILEKEEKLFAGLPRYIEVGHYHSWVVSKDHFPDCLQITSVDAKDQIMSLRHKNYNVCGIQFHPESILTPYGKEMIRNWIGK